MRLAYALLIINDYINQYKSIISSLGETQALIVFSLPVPSLTHKSHSVPASITLGASRSKKASP